MALKVIIPSAESRQRRGKRNPEFTWNEQLVYFDNGLERRQSYIALPDGASTYSPGIYEVDMDKSIEFSPFGGPQFKFVMSFKKVADLPRQAA